MIGFTGTRRGMTEDQASSVAALLIAFKRVTERYADDGPAARVEFHHGLCVGADEQANAIARELGYFTVGHPASNVAERWQSNVEVDRRSLPVPAMERNVLIAQNEFVIAAPKGGRDPRSGTWATVRRARKFGATVFVVRDSGWIDTGEVTE